MAFAAIRKARVLVQGSEGASAIEGMRGSLRFESSGKLSKRMMLAMNVSSLPGNL